MKKRFTKARIAFALRQATNGTAVAEIIQKMGITEQTFYRGRDCMARWEYRRFISTDGRRKRTVG